MPTLETLPNLYATPQDVYELLGTDAAQLRLDDKNLSTGQVVQVSIAVAIGDTSLAVAAIQYPLLRGSRLVFDGAGMTGPVEVTLNAIAAIGATSLNVVPLEAAINAQAQATDNGVNVWLAGMFVKAIKYATAEIKSWCCNRYDDTMLVTSWCVNNWCTILAARWVAKRAFRAAPQGLEEYYKDVIENLRAVKFNGRCIEDIPTRTSGIPYISNVTIDLRYTYRKIRVETTISDPTPTQFPQAVDYGSIYSFEF